jgi:hypothetical protein
VTWVHWTRQCWLSSTVTTPHLSIVRAQSATTRAFQLCEDDPSTCADRALPSVSWLSWSGPGWQRTQASCALPCRDESKEAAEQLAGLALRAEASERVGGHIHRAASDVPCNRGEPARGQRVSAALRHRRPPSSASSAAPHRAKSPLRGRACCWKGKGQGVSPPSRSGRAGRAAEPLHRHCCRRPHVRRLQGCIEAITCVKLSVTETV